MAEQDEAKQLNGKPDWVNAPEWAKHLWWQNDGRSNIFCWSDSKKENANALWSTDIDGRDNFRLRPRSWGYIERRPSKQESK